MSEKGSGKITKKKQTLVEETEIEWEITDILSLIEENFFMRESPVFSFANDSWSLRMYSRNTLDSDYLAVYCSTSNTNRKNFVEYSFGLKKQDGSVEVLIKDTMMKDQNSTNEWKFIKRSEVRQRKSMLLASGNFTIVCRLKCKFVPSVKPNPLNKGKLEKLEKLESLSDNFKSLFLSQESCDAALKVMDKEYKAHRTVLMARSPVFAAMFTHETTEKQTGIVTIPDCDPESFKEFLEFLYSGKLEKPSSRSALHLYETSDKYNVLELKVFCSKFLEQNLTVENLCDVVVMADKYDDSNLLSAAQRFFNKNCSKVLVTSEWECLIKYNYRLSNRLLIEMSRKVKI